MRLYKISFLNKNSFKKIENVVVGSMLWSLLGTNKNIQKVFLYFVKFYFQTRVLVTHGVHWLPMVDTIVVLVNGRITELGSYEQLMSHDGAFAQFLKTYLTQENDDEEEEDAESKINCNEC